MNLLCSVRPVGTVIGVHPTHLYTAAARQGDGLSRQSQVVRSLSGVRQLHAWECNGDDEASKGSAADQEGTLFLPVVPADVTAIAFKYWYKQAITRFAAAWQWSRYTTCLGCGWGARCAIDRHGPGHGDTASRKAHDTAASHGVTYLKARRLLIVDAMVSAGTSVACRGASAQLSKQEM